MRVHDWSRILDGRDAVAVPDMVLMMIDRRLVRDEKERVCHLT